MKKTFRFLSGFSLVYMATVLAGGQSNGQDPQTTTQHIKGESQVTTAQVKGTVVYTEGNTLVVLASSGVIEEFQVAPSRKFIIDGKELTVDQLKPGTALTLTVTTTTTPVTARMTTIGSGRVFWVSQSAVIVTLPNNERRMYRPDESYRFTVDGKPASIHELKKGMMVSGERIVEEPRTEITTNSVVTGTSPH
jgi:glucose/arabinose dehydrogenase